MSSTLNGVRVGVNETAQIVSFAHQSAMGRELNGNTSSGTACLCSASVGAAPRLGAGATQSLAHMSVGLKVELVAGTPTHGLSRGTRLPHKMVIVLKISIPRKWARQVQTTSYLMIWLWSHSVSLLSPSLCHWVPLRHQERESRLPCLRDHGKVLSNTVVAILGKYDLPVTHTDITLMLTLCHRETYDTMKKINQKQG